MTVATMVQADKEMAELFRTAWDLAGYVCDWPNMKANNHSDEDTWARWNIDYGTGAQMTMGGTGGRKFSKEGLIYINVFTPLGAGLENARAAAEIAINAYEGKRTPGDVWFRDVRIESEGHGHGSGKSKGWWTTLVVARFTYETLR